LRTHATARRAVFSDGLTEVSLRDARLDLTRESLHFTAERAHLDLGSLDARGTGQVTLVGPGFVAKSDRFTFDGRSRALEMGPPVHVEAQERGGS
jgi:lipopolysaccharide export system protein LptC